MVCQEEAGPAPRTQPGVGNSLREIEDGGWGGQKKAWKDIGHQTLLLATQERGHTVPLRPQSRASGGDRSVSLILGSRQHCLEAALHEVLIPAMQALLIRGGLHTGKPQLLADKAIP